MLATLARACGYSKTPPSAQSRRNRLIRVLLPPDFDKLIIGHGWRPSRSVVPRSLLWPVNEDRFQELPATLRLRLPLCRAGGVLFPVVATTPAGKALPLPGNRHIQTKGVMGTKNPALGLGRVRGRFGAGRVHPAVNAPGR